MHVVPVKACWKNEHWTSGFFLVPASEQELEGESVAHGVGWGSMNRQPGQPFWHPSSVTSVTLDGPLLLYISVNLSV